MASAEVVLHLQCNYHDDDDDIFSAPPINMAYT